MATYAGIESFDSYSDGDLSGNNGGAGWASAWSGDTDFDVQGVVKFYGAKGLLANVLPNDSNDIVRQLSAGVDSGSFFVALRATGSGSVMAIGLYNSGYTGGVSINFGHQNSGGTRLSIAGTTESIMLNGITTGVWYIVEMEFLSATTARARYKVAGGSFGSWSSTVTFSGGVSSPAYLHLWNNGDSGSSDNFYIDQIGNTDPDVPPIVFAISGTVSLAGSPVEGAVVRCIRQSDNTVLPDTLTDSSGLYLISDLEDGELYHVMVEYEDGGNKYNALSLWDVQPVEVV